MFWISLISPQSNDLVFIKDPTAHREANMVGLEGGNQKPRGQIAPTSTAAEQGRGRHSC